MIRLSLLVSNLLYNVSFIIHYMLLSLWLSQYSTFPTFQDRTFGSKEESRDGTSDVIEVVKSDETPYIVQEKDVLSNIRVVDEAKRKFSGQPY